MKKRLSLRIIMRTFMREDFVRGKARPYNISRRDLVLKSFSSLLESCNLVSNRIVITIVDNNSTEEFFEKLNQIAKDKNVKINIIKGKWGNSGMSMKESYNVAMNCKEDLIYFCEDDYLHLKNEVPEVLEVYEKKLIGREDIGVSPHDNGALYQKIYPSYIFKGEKRHWRSCPVTTSTFFIKRQTFLKYNRFVLRGALQLKDKRRENIPEWTNVGNIWKRVPCLSPIPSLSCHFQAEEEFPPFIDWKKVLEEIKI